MSVPLCLTGEITLSCAGRTYGSTRCPDIGTEGMIDRYHLGNASRSGSFQAAFYELVSGLVTSPLPQAHRWCCEP